MELFAALEPVVVAPSESALETWRNTINYSVARAIVHPHCFLEVSDQSNATQRSGPLRVAFLGYPAPHKGWLLFRELLANYSDDSRFQFFHLGATNEGGHNLTFCHVSVSSTNPDAMVRAVSENAIDIAIISPLWPETFCLIAYEAVAGGAQVLTTEASGNVAGMVNLCGAGIVFKDDTQLKDYFDSISWEIIDTLRRHASHRLRYSALTWDLVSASSPEGMHK